MVRKTIAGGLYAGLNRALWMLAAIVGWCSLAVAQQAGPTGVHIEGSVTDLSGAVIPGAQVRGADGEATTTDAAGHFLLACVPFGSDKLTVQADGFNPSVSPGGQRAGKSSNVTLQLAIAQVGTEVRVNDDPISALRYYAVALERCGPDDEVAEPPFLNHPKLQMPFGSSAQK